MKAEPTRESGVTPRAVRAPARAPTWVVPLVKSLLVIVDAALTGLCFVAAFYLRHFQSVFHRAANGSLSWIRDFAPYALLLPLIIPIRLLLLRYYDLYRVRGEFSFVDDLARVFKARRSARY